MLWNGLKQEVVDGNFRRSMLFAGYRNREDVETRKGGHLQKELWDWGLNLEERMESRNSTVTLSSTLARYFFSYMLENLILRKNYKLSITDSSLQIHSVSIITTDQQAFIKLKTGVFRKGWWLHIYVVITYGLYLIYVTINVPEFFSFFFFWKQILLSHNVSQPQFLLPPILLPSLPPVSFIFTPFHFIFRTEQAYKRLQSNRTKQDMIRQCSWDFCSNWVALSDI